MRGKRSTPMTYEESLCALFQKAYKRPRHRAMCGQYKTNGLPNRFWDVESWARFWKVEEWVARKTLMYLARRSFTATITHRYKPGPTRPIATKVYWNVGPHNLWLKPSSRDFHTESLGVKAEMYKHRYKPRHRRANEFNRNPRTDL